MIVMCLRTRSNPEEWAICSASKRPVWVQEGLEYGEMSNTGGDRMVKRKTVPAYGNCSIALATEEMKDGRWAVVVTVTQSTDTAERNTDLPVTDERFASEAEAEAFGVRSAKEWIDRNTPQTV
jgi:hypothetical protein